MRSNRSQLAAYFITILCFSFNKSAHCNGADQYDFNDPTGYFTTNSLHDKYDQQLTFDQYLTYSIRSVALVAGYDNDLHRYDSKQDLINSYERLTNLSSSLANLNHLKIYDQLDWTTLQSVAARIRRQHKRQHRIDSSELELFSDQSELNALENDINQEDCSSQLDQLIEMTFRLYRNFETYSSSKQLSLIDFLDSFGSAPREQLLMSNNFWLGSHDQCSNARVQYSRTTNSDHFGPATTVKAFDGRYCVAKLNSPNWQQVAGSGPQSTNNLSIKLGVCLPRSCNSISILRHSNKIETLIKLVRFQQVPFSGFKLQNLFCLPDEKSPLRQMSPSAQTFVSCLGVWLTFVLYFSLKYELQLFKGEETKTSIWIKVFAFRYSWQTLFNRHVVKLAKDDRSIDVKLLHEKFHSTSLQKDNQKQKNSVPCSNVGCNQAEFSAHLIRSASQNSSDTSSSREPIKKENKMNLSAVDGVKVLSMVWLISAHTMLFFLRTISNGRDFWSIIMDARFMTIMAGIFPVDSFFTVTGILTTYLKFNKNNGQAMKSPTYWLEAFVHRYLRFMPMYLIVFWYTRDVSQYIGQGPLWDYATANTSLRAMCKEESVTVPLFFQANLKPIDRHCVKPAWYLANDYQYLLITPIYIILLFCSKWFGYLGILATIVASLVAQFHTVFDAIEFTDFEGLVNFRPMFATYVLKDLWRLYTLPYNRIVPYMIGLLTGYLMHLANADRNKSPSEVEAAENNNTTLNCDPLVAQFQTKVQNTTNNYCGSCEYCQTATIAVGNDAMMHCCTQSRSTHQSAAFAEKTNRTSTVGPTNRQSSPKFPSFNALVSSEIKSLDSFVEQHPSINNPQNIRIHQDYECANTQCKAARTLYGQSHEAHQANKTNKGTFLLLGRFFKHHLCIKVWVPLMIAISIIYLPMLTKLMTLEGKQARIGASLIMAFVRLIWSIAIARLVYVCCIDNYGNTGDNMKKSRKCDSFIVSLLSSSIWRPWSKMGLSVLLIQWEIISYLAQIQVAPPSMSIMYMLAFVLTSIVVSYAIGLLVYLTIEFPMSQFEHFFVHPLFSGRKIKQSIK